jgi:hypothetical protein
MNPCCTAFGNKENSVNHLRLIDADEADVIAVDAVH